jgi:hypothetical protein
MIHSQEIFFTTPNDVFSLWGDLFYNCPDFARPQFFLCMCEARKIFKGEFAFMDKYIFSVSTQPMKGSKSYSIKSYEGDNTSVTFLTNGGNYHGGCYTGMDRLLKKVMGNRELIRIYVKIEKA